MATTTQTSFLAGDELPSDGLLNDIYDFDLSAIGDFAQMPGDEVDFLFHDGHPQSNNEQSLHSQDSPIAELQPASSWSQDDSEYQLTPSSTNELPNAEGSSFDLISNCTSSPVDQISPFSNRSSEFSHIAAPTSSDPALSFNSLSQESDDGAHSDPIRQDWSFVGTPSAANYSTAIPETSQSHIMHDVPVQSTVAFNESLLADMNINLVLRPSQPSQLVAVPSVHHTYGHSWGSLQQPQLTIHHNMNAQPTRHHHAYPTPPQYSMPAYDMANAQAGMTFDRRLYNGEQLPLPTQPAHVSPTNRPSSTAVHTVRKEHSRPKELAYSTRRRFPDRPAVTKQKSPPVARQTPRPIAAGPAFGTKATHQHENDETKRKPPGGRKKGVHLTEITRDKVSKMRKLGACWRCKMQRDPCPDDGTPCARCISGAQKGHQYYFECDRSKLPDFVMDFLPPSHTVMYSKQNIEDTVKNQVCGWDFARPVEVHFSSGYGPPFPWVLYEFNPASPELLEQLQYVQDVSTGQSIRFKKWSPPLGILKLDASDTWRTKNYLDELLRHEHLPHFAWRLFEEESQIDDFQATMLALICDLYEKTDDHDLSHLLQRILRMLLINYIMAHTLTITQETLPSVHHHLRSAYKPQFLTPFTSPRLANRQLKFFFSILREEMFIEILKWQQTTLHTSGGKDSTWLHTFIVMLALAMVLEEGQRTIQIQADAKEHKRERSYTDAQSEAANACERIDARFTLLVGLFQCKYRDKKWIRGGSFGPQTPRLRNPVEHEFCEELRDLLVERQDHLRSRKDVPFSSKTQCQYTTRLVARFLLPFLDLPG